VVLADRSGGCVMPRRPKHPPASEVVRKAILESGLPIRELARRTGVEPSVLSRFMSGQTGISLSTFEKLADELGLRVMREPHKDADRPRVSGRLRTEEPAVTSTKPGRRRRTVAASRARNGVLS
jgi:Helix-turn-helix